MNVLLWVLQIFLALHTVEMLLFCGLHLYSGDTNYGHIIYWLVVAAISAFIAYGRFVLKPVQIVQKEK